MNANARPYLKYVLGLLIYGSNGVIASFISLGSQDIVLLRSLLGCGLLAAVFFTMGNKPKITHNPKGSALVCASGVAMAADWLLLFEAFDQIGVGLAMVINYTGPAIVMALSPMFFGERLSSRKTIALLLALAGAIMTSGTAVATGISLYGIVLAALSAVAYAIMIITNKKADGIEGLENPVLQMTSTAATVLVFVWLTQGLEINLASTDWVPMLWLGLVNTGVASFLFFSSIGKLPAQTVSILGYLEPLSAIVFAAMLLGESMAPVQILGACLIVAGAILGELRWRSKDRCPSKAS